MFPLRGGDLDCQRCGYELQGGESVCPRCQYSPRQRGLKVSLSFLMALIILMSGAIIFPTIGPIAVGLAALSFILSFITFIISFLARPYRFGTLFLRL